MHSNSSLTGSADAISVTWLFGTLTVFKDIISHEQVTDWTSASSHIFIGSIDLMLIVGTALKWG